MSKLMGILNVTPDSFSDGGQHLDSLKAHKAALQMVEQGASWIDVGGESTRPGSVSVSLEQELERVLPVLDLLQDIPAQISIDTTKAEVAKLAIERGASLVNDTSALRDDPQMINCVGESGVCVVLMHRLDKPKTMQENPQYDDVVSEICAFFEQRISWAVGRGLKEQQILLDPGIGFGKSYEHNLQILREIERFAQFGLPLLVGASRKACIGQMLGGVPSEQRLIGSVTVASYLASHNVDILRVHDVLASRQAMDVLKAIGDVPNAERILAEPVFS